VDFVDNLDLHKKPEKYYGEISQKNVGIFKDLVCKERKQQMQAVIRKIDKQYLHFGYLSGTETTLTGEVRVLDDLSLLANGYKFRGYKQAQLCKMNKEFAFEHDYLEVGHTWSALEEVAK